MTLSVDEVRARVTTALGNEALQDMLDAEYEAIDRHVGKAGGVSELLSGRGDLLMLSRRAISITTLTERGLALDPTDYELRSSGRTLRRLPTGPHPSRRWRGVVDVAYLPYLVDAQRDEVAVQLLQQDLNHSPGLASETIGAWSQTYSSSGGVNYDQERAMLLGTLDDDFILL